MTSFEKEIKGLFGDFWKKDAENRVAQVRKEFEDGKITVDENGIASLKIRLMSGEYIITSYWNDFQTGNTIKISP